MAGGYGTVMRVRTRKGREIGDAKWPRSIVNQSALVADWNLVVRTGCVGVSGWTCISKTGSLLVVGAWRFSSSY